MDKLLVFPSRDENGVFFHSFRSDRPYLTKEAAAGNYHPKIADYIRSASEIPGKLQVLVTALGAGEYYGSNINGDWFGEDHLKYEGPEYGHKTFESTAKVFKHHVNKPDSPSYGTVALSVWNDKMKRVELILIVDRAKAPDICQRIDNGEYLELSMGCRVPYDVCNCCGNKAKTREQYCEHLKKYMNRIPPGYNKKAFAKNPWPKFHDISFVLIGADTIAKVMAKVASVQQMYFVGSADLAAAVAGEPVDEGLQKVASAYGFIAEKSAAVLKKAEIKKRVPSNLDGTVMKKLDLAMNEGVPLIRRYEPAMPHALIIRITSSGTPGIGLVNKVLSTILGAGIVPKHGELQELMLRGLGQHALADDYKRRGVLFDPATPVPADEQAIYDKYVDIGPQNFDPEMMNLLGPLLGERSYAKPLLHRRLIRILANGQPPPTVEKTSMVVGPLAMMVTLAGLYAAVRRKDPVAAMNGFERLVVQHPAMAAALGAGLISGFGSLSQTQIVGQSDIDPRSGNAERPLDLAGFVNMVNARPMRGDYEKRSSLAGKVFFGVPALYTLSGLQEAYRMRHPGEEEGTLSSVTRAHPDILSAALVGEHLMGQPITKRIPDITQKVKGALAGGLSLLRKTAAADAEAFALEAGPEPARAADLMESAILNNTVSLVHKWRS